MYLSFFDGFKLKYLTNFFISLSYLSFVNSYFLFKSFLSLGKEGSKNIIAISSLKLVCTVSTSLNMLE